MTSSEITRRRAEFDAHVWNHADDVFQSSFDLRSPLEIMTLDRLAQLVAAMESGGSDDDLSALLRQQAQSDPDYLLTVLQLVGLTRNKPVTDLKVPLRERGIPTPANVRNFASKPQVWKLAGTYFAMRLRTVFTHLIGLERQSLNTALEALNQSTWPGYIRQERAKRSGGYAEQRFAIVLRSLGIPFAPEGKADNGLTADASIAGESFDIVVPDVRRPKLCVISMLHSSNIGQYGESKAGDAQRAKHALGTVPSKPKLAVLADGVGFHSNVAGLTGLLAGADEFFQLATLWKGAVLAASATGRSLAVVVPDLADHRDFVKTYTSHVKVLKKTDGKPGWVEAGEGLVRPI
jgi:hypothetical protein